MKLTVDRPLVSVGMPIKNGMPFLERVVENIQNQSYENLEIIISDNCSNDKTSEFLNTVEASDYRVRILKQTRPISAFENFEVVLRASKGEYFLWASHDDLRNEDYVNQLMSELTRSPKSVLAFGQLFVSSEFGTNYSKKDFKFATSGRDPLSRALSTTFSQYYHIYGLWRINFLKRFRFINNPYYPDMPLMLAASFLGEFIYVDKAKFYYYEVLKDDLYRASYQDNSEPKNRLLTIIMLMIAAFKTVSSSSNIFVGVVASGLVILKVLMNMSIKFRRLIVSRFKG